MRSQSSIRQTALEAEEVEQRYQDFLKRVQADSRAFEEIANHEWTNILSSLRYRRILWILIRALLAVKSNDVIDSELKGLKNDARISFERKSGKSVGRL
ncbi:MAG: hypothetical protein KDK99_21940 [Verrucomicrobiales bacterium]|nr:hypothetical protein [Verrucomicrobiales bacterium]